MITRRTFTLTAAAAAVAAVAPAVSAEAINPIKPEAPLARPIRIIVPFARNGTTDQIARMIADPMSTALGVSVTVENITGDWGITGTTLASEEAADGSVLIMGQTATHVSPPLRKGIGLRYDVVRDFTPIGMVGAAPITFVGRITLPAFNLDSLRDIVRAHPEALAIVHGGFGTPSHLGARKLKTVFGTPALSEKAYASTMAALQDVSAGRADIMATSLPQALPFIKAGTVKPLGLASTSRNIALPDVYTGTQQGYVDLRLSHWNGLFAPKGLAADVQARLAKGLSAALADPATARKMREQGIHVPFEQQQGPAALAALQAREIAELAEAVA